MSPEYAKLMGVTATQGKSAMPGPLDVGGKLWQHARHPFYDNGPNDKGLGIQLAFSIARVAIGYLLAVAVAVPIGFLIGMSPLMSKALDPFIQVLKPISPLAWMPLALYTIKDSSLSGDLCDLHLLAVADHDQHGLWRRSGAARMVERSQDARGPHVRRAFTIILPAAAPTILHRHAHFHRHRLAGDRGGRNVWVGGTGIGYFVWT